VKNKKIRHWLYGSVFGITFIGLICFIIYPIGSGTEDVLQNLDDIQTTLDDNQTQIDANYAMIIRLTERLNQIQPHHARVKITFYTSGSHTKTAINEKVGSGKVAVSRDLLGLFPFGSRIWIEGFGVRTVSDVTHKDIKNTVDIWTPRVKNSKRENVLVVSIVD
jgi:3D (Asp-Asp-Asp) domain-containing protein